MGSKPKETVAIRRCVENIKTEKWFAKTGKQSGKQSDKSGKSTKWRYACGKDGHLSTECWHAKDIPKEDWTIHKAKQMYQQDGQKNHNDKKESKDQDTKVDGSSQNGWNGVQLFNVQEAKYEFFLDTGLTLNLFKDCKLVANI